MSRGGGESSTRELNEDMSKQIYEGSLDKRIIQMKIKSGELKEEQLQEYLRRLPDVSANAEPMATVMERTDHPAS